MTMRPDAMALAMARRHQLDSPRPARYSLDRLNGVPGDFGLRGKRRAFNPSNLIRIVPAEGLSTGVSHPETAFPLDRHGLPSNACGVTP